MKACPYCAEQIQDAAILCRFCQRDLPGQSLAADSAVSATRVELATDKHQQFLERGPAADYQVAKAHLYNTAGGCAQLIGYALIGLLILWVLGVVLMAFS